MNEQRRTELIKKADRLAKRVNDNLYYLYKTAPNKAIIAETAIYRYNKGVPQLHLTKSGKVQLSRNLKDLTTEEIESYIERIERISASRVTSAMGFRATEKQRNETFRKMLSESGITGAERVSNEILNILYRQLSKVREQPYDSKQVIESFRLLKDGIDVEDLEYSLAIYLEKGVIPLSTYKERDKMRKQLTDKRYKHGKERFEDARKEYYGSKKI